MQAVNEIKKKTVISSVYDEQTEEHWRNTFKDHVITEIEPKKEYRWGRPNSIIYSVNILCRGSRLFIYGDMYDWIFARAEPMFGFLIGSINSFDYFFEKLSSRETPYDEKMTKQSIIERIEELWDYEIDSLTEDEIEDLNIKSKEDMIECVKRTDLDQRDVSQSLPHLLEEIFEGVPESHYYTDDFNYYRRSWKNEGKPIWISLYLFVEAYKEQFKELDISRKL